MFFFEVTWHQIQQARELLGISRHELGLRSGVSRLTVRLWEAARNEPSNAMAPKLAAMVRYLQAEGVCFTEKNGVRLERPAVSATAPSAAVTLGAAP